MDAAIAHCSGRRTAATYFLNKVAALDPVVWLPKTQAARIRLQDALFEPATPGEAKAKLRAAAPAGRTIVIYKSASEFNAVVRSKKELDWIQSELNVRCQKLKAGPDLKMCALPPNDRKVSTKSHPSLPEFYGSSAGDLVLPSLPKARFLKERQTTFPSFRH